MTLNHRQLWLFWKLLRSGPTPKAARVLDRMDPADISDVLERAGPSEHVALMELLLEPTRVDTLLRSLPPEVVRPHLLRCDHALLCRRIGLMASDDALVVLTLLPEERREAVLAALPQDVARQLIRLAAYPPNAVGRLMNGDPFAIQSDVAVGDAMAEIRARAARGRAPALYLYVVDDTQRLRGVISPEAMLRADLAATVGSLAETDPVTLSVLDDSNKAAQLVTRHGFLALPVVEADGHLVGTLSVVDIIDAVNEQVTADLYALQGVPTDDSLHAGAMLTVKRRLPWMLINLATAFAAAGTVGLFKQTIARLAVLAVYMPVVAGMGGNVGTQVLTMVTRAMALGKDVFVSPRQLLRRQVGVSALIGLLVGGIAAGVAWGMQRDPQLAAVLLLAMVVNLTSAGLLGVVVPLALRRAHQDPALGSGVIVTTFTDVIGFLSFLGLATLVLRT